MNLPIYDTTKNTYRIVYYYMDNNFNDHKAECINDFASLEKIREYAEMETRINPYIYFFSVCNYSNGKTALLIKRDVELIHNEIEKHNAYIAALEKEEAKYNDNWI